LLPVAGHDWLDTTFSCTEYKVWIRTQAKDVQQESAACRAVVNDVAFTSLCADIAAFFDPAIILLRLADTDLPNVSKMVPSSYLCKSKMEEFRTKLPFAATCIEKYEKREEDLLHPIHFAAYLVDPQYLDHKQLTNPMCMEGFLNFIEKRFPGDVAKQTAAVASLSAFKNGDGVFGREAAKLAAMTMPAYRWFQMYCFQEAELQEAGGELCSLFTMQSGSERNHKMEGVCKSKMRNRLLSETTNKVVYVCANSRLRDKVQAPLYTEGYLEWNEALPGTNNAVMARGPSLSSEVSSFVCHSLTHALTHPCTR
jgi:hypothetical protein